MQPLAQTAGLVALNTIGERKELTSTIDRTLTIYGIENWGADYFGVNKKGNLVVHPSESDNRAADLKDVVDDLRRRGINPPILLRFPQLIAAQVRKLHRSFKSSIKEFEYKGGHMCVYPMKVNQNRAVVEEYLREGSRYWFKHGTRVGRATVDSVEYRHDLHTLEPISADQIELNDLAMVRLSLSEPIVASPYEVSREGGRLILVDEATNTTAGAMMITVAA